MKRDIKPFKGKKAFLFINYFFDAMDTWATNRGGWTKGMTYEEECHRLDIEASRWAKMLWEKVFGFKPTKGEA